MSLCFILMKCSCATSFCPHFPWAELRILRLFLCTQKAYFSQILFINLSKSVLVALLLCRNNPSTSQVCHIKMLIRLHDYCKIITLKCAVLLYLGGGGGDPKTSQYLVWPPFASHSATHLLCIELIRLLIVACAMLVHSSSMAVWSCWILAGTETLCRIRRSRAS